MARIILEGRTILPVCYGLVVWVILGGFVILSNRGGLDYLGWLGYISGPGGRYLGVHLP